MKIGLVGYQGSGKSTLFEWLTGVKPDPALSHTAQAAMAAIPEARVAALCKIYTPKKVTTAALELVDTPGLSRTHEGNPARLVLLREKRLPGPRGRCLRPFRPHGRSALLRRRPHPGRHGNYQQPAEACRGVAAQALPKAEQEQLAARARHAANGAGGHGGRPGTARPT